MFIREDLFRSGPLRGAAGPSPDGTVQCYLMNTTGAPPDDFFQAMIELPAARYPHSVSFLGSTYGDELTALGILFIAGRSKQTRLALHRDLNARIVAATGISPAARPQQGRNSYY